MPVPAVAPATLERATAPTAAPTGFAPSSAQRAAKSKLLIAMRHDPLLDPAQLPLRQLAAICGVGEQTIHDWYKRNEFRTFLLARYEMEERAVSLLGTALDHIGERLGGMSDKDLIQAAKLLADVVQKQEDAAAPEPDLSKLPPEQLRALIERVLPLLPPIPGALAQVDVTPTGEKP